MALGDIAGGGPHGKQPDTLGCVSRLERGSLLRCRPNCCSGLPYFGRQFGTYFLSLGAAEFFAVFLLSSGVTNPIGRLGGSGGAMNWLTASMSCRS